MSIQAADKANNDWFEQCIIYILSGIFLFEFFVVGLSATLRTIAAILILSLALFVVLRERLAAVRIPWMSIMLGIIMLFSLQTLITGWVNPSETIGFAIFLLSQAALVWLISECSPKNKARLLVVLYGSVSIASFLSLLAVGHLVLPTWFLGQRIGGPLQYADTFGSLVGTAYWLGWWLWQKRLHLPKPFSKLFKQNLTFVLIQSILIASLLWTVSRGALLAMALGTLIFLILGSERWITLFLKTFFFGGLLSLALVFAGLAAFIIACGVIILAESIQPFPGSDWRRTQVILAILSFAVITSFIIAVIHFNIGSGISGPLISGHTFQDRLAYWQVALRILGHYPLGVGSGGWADLYPYYQTFAFYSLYVHNTYLQTLVNTGILGGMVLSCYGIALLSKIITSLRKSMVYRIRNISLLSALTILIIHAGGDLDGAFVSFWFIILVVIQLAAGHMLNINVRWHNLFVLRWATVLLLVISLFIGVAWTGSDIYTSIGQGPTPKVRYLKFATYLNPFSAEPVLILAAQESRKPKLSQSDRMGIQTQLATAAKLRPMSSDVDEKIGLIWSTLDQPAKAWKWFQKAVFRAPYRTQLYLLAFEAAQENAIQRSGDTASWHQTILGLYHFMRLKAKLQPSWITAREALNPGLASVQDIVDNSLGTR